MNYILPVLWGMITMQAVNWLVDTNRDINFKSVEAKYKQSVLICELMQSTPESVDYSEVTCKNGKTVNWR